ncbi:MAG TPA: Gfo/Idh/MocA family oxidoreductase [Caldimonas sp.]|jgi:predicted dehydrogenase|nr:Gfo/Idh/MocA family oxidoreductase [Caldimonas sp.]HEX2541931.1 Gfo/Idh/MocA family oxidoreductase [Caldimonas sp.]
MTSPSVVRFGIVGTGQMAVRMTHAITRLPGASIVGVASGSPARAERFAGAFAGVRAHPDEASLLADAEVDAVYVCNATASHAAATLRALRAGKPVLCEKPMATSAAEGREIEAAAESSGRLVMEAMWTLFLPAYVRLAERVEAEREHGPQHLYADFGYPMSGAEERRLLTPGAGAGVLLDRGVYPLALALKLFGPVQRMSGTVELTSENVDRHAVLHLQHAGGVQAQIAVSLRVLLQNRVTVSSSSGLLGLDPPAIPAEVVRSVSAGRSAEPVDPLARPGVSARAREALRLLPPFRRLNRLRTGGHAEHRTYGADPYLPMLSHFCQLVRSGQRGSERMPVAMSTAVLDLVDRARQLPTP